MDWRLRAGGESDHAGHGHLASGRKCVHAAPPDLRRALRGGNVMRVRKIVWRKSVFTNNVRAIRSVLIRIKFIGKTKNRIRVPTAAILTQSDP